MADIHIYGLEKSNTSTLQSSKYEAMTLRCGSEDFKLHRAIVCPHSRFFAAACDGRFQVRDLSSGVWRGVKRANTATLGGENLHNCPCGGCKYANENCKEKEFLQQKLVTLKGELAQMILKASEIGMYVKKAYTKREPSVTALVRKLKKAYANVGV